MCVCVSVSVCPVILVRNISPLLVNRSSSNLIERKRIRTSQFAEKFIMIAFTIKTQARINDVSTEMGQGKQSDISDITKIEHLFPFISSNINGKRESRVELHLR